MRERSGKEIWNEWMEELTPPFTVSYNPAGILYAKERIAELEKERNYLKQYVERLAAGVPIPDTPGSILSALPEEGK